MTKNEIPFKLISTDTDMTRTVLSNNIILYTNESGRYHREDGPAVIFPYGPEQWYKNGKLHREDGPAVINPDGTEQWFMDGIYHREDGPAVTYPDGDEYWFINGKNVTKLVKDHVFNWKNWSDKEKLTFKLKFL